MCVCIYIHTTWRYIYIYTYIYTPTPTHTSIFFPSSISGHLSYFYILATVNNAAMNIGVHISFWFSAFVFFGQIPGSGCWIVWHLYFLLLWYLHTVFHSAVPSAVPPTVHKCSFFSTSSPTLVNCLFDNNHSHIYEMISHCGFYLYFPDDLVMMSTVLVGHLYVIFGKTPI